MDDLSDTDCSASMGRTLYAKQMLSVDMFDYSKAILSLYYRNCSNENIFTLPESIPRFFIWIISSKQRIQWALSSALEQDTSFLGLFFT